MCPPERIRTPGPAGGSGLVIEHIPDVLTFTLDNPSHGNEVTGPLFAPASPCRGAALLRPLYFTNHCYGTLETVF